MPNKPASALSHAGKRAMLKRLPTPADFVNMGGRIKDLSWDVKAKPKRTPAQCVAIATELRKMMYDILKEEGVCVRCGSLPADDGYVHCGECRDYWAEHFAEVKKGASIRRRKK